MSTFFKPFVLFILMVLLCVPVAQAAQVDYTQAMADYTIPSHIKANSIEDYYGAWKASYAVYGGTAFDSQKVLGFDCYAFFYQQRGFFEASKNSLYITYNDIQNGVLICNDGQVDMDVYLNSDGTLSFNVSGVDLYWTRAELPLENISFKSLQRNPENFIEHFAQFTGSIIDVTGSRTAADSYYQIRLAVNGDPDAIMFVEFIKAPDCNLLAGDNITVSVLLAGEYTYQTVRGNNLTVPLGFAYECTLNN